MQDTWEFRVSFQVRPVNTTFQHGRTVVFAVLASITALRQGWTIDVLIQAPRINLKTVINAEKTF